MNKILLFVFSSLLGHISFGQSDSVYLSTNTRKLISKIEIVTPFGSDGIREKYTHFKNRYWLDEIDTVSIVNFKNSKTNKKQYFKYGICDSIINEVRNSSQYWRMRSSVDKLADKDIGYDNIDFNRFKNSEGYPIPSFSSKCQIEFEAENRELELQLMIEIIRIKEGKIDRYYKLKLSPESIDGMEIDSFLKTFNACDTDLKSLELIIIQNPTEFINSIDSLNNSEFLHFTFKINEFSPDSKILEMKTHLKETEIKSERKKKIIKKMKKQKISKVYS